MANKGLIPRDKLFFEALLDGSGIAESAKKAGYRSSEIYETAMPALQNRFAQIAARQNMETKLRFEAAPMAYRIMLRMLEDETTPKNVRVDIAKYLHSVAGYTPPKAQEAPAPTKSEKDLNDMTTEELRAFISNGERELANRAQDVTPVQAIEDML